MIQRTGVSHKQKMSQRTIIVIAATSSLLALIAVLFFVFNIGNIRHGFANTPNPQMNMRWVTLSTSNTVLKVRLEVESSTLGNTLNSGDFYMEYDPTSVTFAGFAFDSAFDPARGGSGIYYSGKGGSNVVDFGPNTGFDVEGNHEMDITVVSTGNQKTGVTIPNNAWVGLVDLTFNVLNPGGNTKLTLNPEMNGTTLSGIFVGGPNLPMTNWDQGTGFGVTEIAPLAVSMTSFTGELQNNQTVLKWSTSSETNSQSFTVEKSQNSVDFQSIATVQAAGNTDVTQDYVDYDNQPLPGVSYYRLIINGMDGKHDTSAIVSINNVNNLSGISLSGEQAFNFEITSVSPTVFHDNVTINYNTSAGGGVRMLIVSMKGNVVSDVQLTATPGVNSYNMPDVGTWLPGVYAVTMYSDGMTAFGRMVKQ